MKAISFISRATALLLICASASATTARAEKQLRWKFTSGNKLSHNMTQQTKMTMQAGGQDIQTTMDQIVDGTWVVNSVDDRGHAQITQSIDRVRMKMQGPQGALIDIDTANDQQPQGIAAMIAPALQAMAKAKFNITVNPQGEVLNVDVPEDLLDTFQKLPGAEQMGGMFTKDGFTNMIKQGTPSFPAEPVDMGTTWDQSFEMKMPPLGTMVIVTKFTYAGEEQVEGRTLDKVDVAMEMNLQPGPPGGPVGDVAITDQKSSGAIYFDNQAGRMTQSKINQDMTMQLSAGGQQIDQRINQVITATLTPLP